MKSIKAHFNHLYKYPLSTYMAFSGAVRGRKFSRDSISRNFMEFVDKDDYQKEDKNILIDHLYLLSNKG